MFDKGDRVIVPVKGVILKRRNKAQMEVTRKRRFDVKLELNLIEEDGSPCDIETIIIKDYNTEDIQCYDCEISPALRELAEKIISKMPDLWFIDEFVGRENIAYVLSYEPKMDRATGKMVHADCRKVKQPFRAFMDYQYIITVYEPHTDYMSEAQLALLMWHELKHIPMSGKLVPHDVEDFRAIIETYGIHWSAPDADIPNILAGDDDDKAKGRRSRKGKQG